MAKITREDIVHAAIVLFKQNGYHATSMRDIALAVEIKKPSLYHHFESKEAILLLILEAGMDHLISELEVITATKQDCVSKLRAAIYAHASTITDNPAAAAVFLREDRGLGNDYMSHYLNKRDHFEGLFRQIVQEGIETGEFQTTDVAIAVHGLLGMVNWMTRWYRTDGRLDAKAISDMFADIFLTGLLSKPNEKGN